MMKQGTHLGWLLVIASIACLRTGAAYANGAPILAATAEEVPFWRGKSFAEVKAERDARLAALRPDPIRDARALVAAYPYRAEYREQLFDALLAAGQQDEALREALACLELHPYYASLRLKLADLYAARGEYDLAVREYRYVITDNPRHVRARVQYAILLEKLDRRVEANQQWTAVKERTEMSQLLQTAARRIAENN